MQFKHIAKKFFGNLFLLEVGVIVLLIVIGSLLFHRIEHHGFLDSMYFMVMTMSTIGYGDITPHTEAGKWLVMIYALMGVPLFVSLSGIILENRFNRSIKRHITKFYREIHTAENELKVMEEKVASELGDIMEETGSTEEKVEDTQKDVKITQKKVDKIEKEVKAEAKKEKEIEAEMRKPRWKKIIRR